MMTSWRTVAGFAMAFLCPLSLCAAAVGAAGTTGPNFWQTPAIEGVGRMHPLPHAAYRPNASETYRIVFSVTKGADKPGQVSPSLDRVARTVNLYVSAGVPLSHLDFVAILYGAATAAALDNTHFEEKFGTENPNLAVIAKLRKAGVKVAVCGQAVAEHGYRYDWITPEVALALSALTTITMLEQRGYALMPL